MTTPTVFISYSHKDEAWKDRLVSHLGVLQRERLLDLWDDRRIGAGEDWHQEIQESIAKASVAILLVSAEFLTSKFILMEVVQRLLERHKRDEIRIFPIVVRPCAWKQIKWLACMNIQPKDGKPLSCGNEHQININLAAIADEVTHDPIGPERISLFKLPSTSFALFGREKELKTLDAAWANPKTNIITLVGWGGVGKTALVNTWLNRMRNSNFRGAECIYGWSFYSQGASEGKQASADLFIASALNWFGDPEPEKGSPWDKGERLAKYIKKKKTLLILEGLEPLQSPSGEIAGRIKDPSLQSLLRGLAYDNPGLCVITTRLEVDDIIDFIGISVEKIFLDRLSPDAGMELLKHLGVKGTPEELKQASSEFGCHALTLTLFGRYLTAVYQGDIRKCDRITKLTDEQNQGAHTRQIMRSYEEWFKGKPELNILYLMGLFDRPAEGGALEALKAKPPIEGLTSKLQKLSYEKWQFALNNLRKVGIIAGENLLRPYTLNCHPLIREHFGQRLKENNPEAWKEGHSRLYEYYKNQAKEYPETIEEIMPLYVAVAHGCEAGRHQEALVEVYWHRIFRINEYLRGKKIGVFGTNLYALSGFFEVPWSKTIANLTEADKAFVLNEVGNNLRALGRLNEAAQLMEAGLEIAISQENWKNSATAASNLSQLYLAIGDIALALDFAKQSVDFVDRTDDVFQRISKLANLADALHQAGFLLEAESLFREAEKIQKEQQPEYPFLYSIQGFLYCDLLLSQRKYHEVQNRASQTLKWAKLYSIILETAFDNLSLGRALLLQIQPEGKHDFTQAEIHLNKAMEGLRLSGHQDQIPRALLARAELHRMRCDFPKAQQDLDEAMAIAERGGMGLHKVDCHLEYANLYLTKNDMVKALENLDIAKKMIGKMGYHRRDCAISELESML